jgi:hypothetical protein
MTGNQQLAERARQLAGRAGNGTRERKAALCLAVALGTTGTLASARKALRLIDADAIRQAAAKLLDDLTTQERP